MENMNREQQRPNNLASSFSLPTEAESSFIQNLRLLVADAGGEFVGIQENMFPEVPLLMFNSPTSKSTLAVRINPVCYNERDLKDAIRKRITESDAEFANRKITVKTYRFVSHISSTDALTGELEQILGRKK